ncbi:MAG: MarR family transcriptional regulator [Methanobrevibacter sp.]|nr:MarR family transcriptional regulator [Methanobrevibacter sp.]
MVSVNSEKVLNFLKAHYGQEYSKQQIADALNITVPAVTGTINSLIKKNYATTTREEKEVISEATETRKERFRMIKYHTLTESGLAYDPVAEEAAKAEQKAAEKARKAAEKAAAKA